MQILIAPNAFKHSLTADAAAAAIATGFMNSQLNCSCECFPVGDGGDGTAGLLIRKRGGLLVRGDVRDPLGREIQASFGLIEDGTTGVIEMADASGIRLLLPVERNPLQASSYGTGEQVKSALDHGARKIIIGMGGSATVDGGAGMLQALGVKFLDASGNELIQLPDSLVRLHQVDLSALDQRLFAAELIVLCDVDNRLLGREGAASIFGPQKGASPKAIEQLEAALSRLAAVALQQTGKDMSAVKYGGTAGGAAAGLFAFLGARLVQGIDFFLELTEFDRSLEKCDLLITGEGSIDEQTLQGKAPFGVARRARARRIPVIGIAGSVPLKQNEHLQQYFDALLPIGHRPADLATALTHTAANLTRTSREIGNLLAVRQSGRV